MASSRRLGSTIATGLGLPEAPRYRSGTLYLSDMLARRVVAVDTRRGGARTVAQLDQRPGGIGWTPDGRMWVVGMDSRELLEVREDGTHPRVDLSPFGSVCNDMVISDAGMAYIGTFELGAGETSAERITGARPSPLVGVDLVNGSAPVVVAEDLMLPNGMVIDSDSDVLLVAETTRQCITAFDVEADGRLTGRRVWAQLSVYPDGICLDEDGGVWVAVPTGPGGFHRVVEGGAVTEVIGTRAGFACTLGGAGGRDLFLLETADWPPLAAGSASGSVRRVRVEAAHAGVL